MTVCRRACVCMHDVCGTQVCARVSSIALLPPGYKVSPEDHHFDQAGQLACQALGICPSLPPNAHIVDTQSCAQLLRWLLEL